MPSNTRTSTSCNKSSASSRSVTIRGRYSRKAACATAPPATRTPDCLLAALLPPAALLPATRFPAKDAQPFFLLFSNSRAAPVYNETENWRGSLHCRDELRLHQRLRQLQPVARRIAKRRQSHDARNFFDLAFELHASRFQALAFMFDVLHAQYDRSSRLFAGTRIHSDADAFFAFRACELRPLLRFKRFLQTEHVAVKFLCAFKIIYAEPGNHHFHCFAPPIEFGLLCIKSFVAHISAKRLKVSSLSSQDHADAGFAQPR